jgi:argininosuccinate lyase
MKKDQKKLWGGRFEEVSSDVTERLSMSVHYDKRLYKQDIRGSKAHSEMLNKIGILSDDDLKKIHAGLAEIESEIESGSFEFKQNLEDIHMNIEAKLTEKIGDAGKRLHTGRSRNDQVALDTRMYIRDEIVIIDMLLRKLIALLINIAEKNIDVIMPGYTHLQVAQPVRFSHHMLAHAWALSRDLQRLKAAFNASNFSPLGVGALAGVNYENDRYYVKDKLEFEDITANSMDTVADRDYVLDFLYFASVNGTHLSRFCEELVLWSSSEFDFIRLSDQVTTGSSIMPQKRNPDLAELIRGKSGRLNGNLIALLTTIKGLPLTYNRDLQEDKEPLFDSIDVVKLSLEGMFEMLKDVQVKSDVMKKAVYSNFSTATDLADYLVKKGVPFRESHEIVGNIVNFCEKEGEDFFGLSLDKLKHFSKVIDADISEVLNPESSTERKTSAGSTAKEEVYAQIGKLKEMLKDEYIN